MVPAAAADADADDGYDDYAAGDGGAGAVPLKRRQRLKTPIDRDDFLCSS